MGTRYVRDTPAPTELTIEAGESVIFDVEDIYTEIPISNTIVPQMRQARESELDFVSIIARAGYNQVFIDGSDLEACEQYEIVLESFDSESSLDYPSALKTDSITL